MKKIDYPREQLSVRLETELAKAFKIALIQNGETAQAVLEQAVKDYLAEPKN